jgi:hypothetical protein
VKFEVKNPLIETESTDLVLLLEIALEDLTFKEKLHTILELDSFNRRSALTLWLELLRIRKMPEPMIDALSILFDDRSAVKMFKLINNQESTHKPRNGGMS